MSSSLPIVEAEMAELSDEELREVTKRAAEIVKDLPAPLQPAALQ
jgi:hypothetical protein